MRDLQKELTAFVPAALRKKKGLKGTSHAGIVGGSISGSGSGIGSGNVTGGDSRVGASSGSGAVRSGVGKFVVNAAPDVEVDDDEELKKFLEEI
jgi:hypothetical protein